MAQLRTIKAPTRHSKTGELVTIDIEGRVAWLMVGEVKHKFFLQYMDDQHREVALTDYASGRRLASLTPIKLKYARSYSRLPDREAAELLIAELVAQHGAQEVLSRLLNVERMNK